MRLSKDFFYTLREDAKDEDTKIDEDKKIFNLKTLIHKLRKKKKDDTEN